MTEAGKQWERPQNGWKWPGNSAIWLQMGVKCQNATELEQRTGKWAEMG